MHVELFGASSIEDHGRFRFEKYVEGLPNIRDQGFDTVFAALISGLGIDLVFATHDSVHDYLAGRASAMGFALVNGDPAAAKVARSKNATYALFADCAWVPKVFASVDAVDMWPIVVKPDEGQGGQGVRVVRGAADALQAISAIESPVFVEYLPGNEITVDCFTDRRRNLLWIGPRTRERVKAGISMRSTVLEATPEITAIAAEINARMNMRGPWFFQLKGAAVGIWKLLEVSCRVGGAMATQRARGINLPLMAVQDFLGRDVVPLPIPQIGLVDRCITTRAQLQFEYSNVCVDLDETLIIDGAANPVVLAFLYQAVAQGKRVVLITRHARDICETLESARIAPRLFDEIIHLTAGESKADHVPESSIFIDNHFPERLEVMRRAGVPAFDVDALEFLIR